MPSIGYQQDMRLSRPRLGLYLRLGVAAGFALACLASCKGSGGMQTGGAGTTGIGGSGNAAAGAGGAPGEDGAVAFSRADLLAAFGTCAANQVRGFRDRATALDAAASAYVAAPDATT